MDTQLPLKVILESRTYLIYNFRSFTYSELYSSIADLLCDSEPTFDIMIPNPTKWILISDNDGFASYIQYSVSPIIYIVYPHTPCLIRVQTYNLSTNTKQSKWRMRVHMIAQQIKEISADIIALQDVSSKSHSRSAKNIEKTGKNKKKTVKTCDTLKDLMELLPEYSYSYWHISHRRHNGDTEGIAIISRFPIIETKSIKLAKYPKSVHNDSCLKVIIDHPKRKLSIYNAQLASDSKYQAHQAYEIYSFMNSEESPFLMQVLLADTNIKDNFSLPADFLEGKFPVNSAIGNLKDAWKFSHVKSEGYTFPSWHPLHRYDRIYYRNIEDPPICEVAGYAENSHMYASEHCSVYADFIVAIE
ncbi:unnamed protein product [Blepharisma stoltei]|uniref:Endonuclease/exonuclease/phosphatase domain-containing protein n=1 Tax=Blepharisma stoltei TaxID=1481888 RepID=A0AAU9J5H9_9CILI|nr:unnamed protein product [Blepharisma stoltei]